MRVFTIWLSIAILPAALIVVSSPSLMTQPAQAQFGGGFGTSLTPTPPQIDWNAVAADEQNQALMAYRRVEVKTCADQAYLKGYDNKLSEIADSFGERWAPNGWRRIMNFSLMANIPGLNLLRQRLVTSLASVVGECNISAAPDSAVTPGPSPSNGGVGFPPGSGGFFPPPTTSTPPSGTGGNPFGTATPTPAPTAAPPATNPTATATPATGGGFPGFPPPASTPAPTATPKALMGWFN